jgi:AraC-like DNA-binding protein
MGKFWIMLLCVAAGAVGVPYYFWHQATQLPNGFGDRAIAANTIDLNDRVALQAARQNAQSKLARIQPAADGTVEVEFTDAELNDLLAAEVASVVEAQNLASAVKGISTTIADGKIASGAVIDLTAISDISDRNLNWPEKTALQAIAQVLPGLTDREVYVGVEGTPAIEAGRLKLDNTHIRVGNLRFSLADIAQRIGISEAELRQQLDRQLPLDQFGIQAVQLTGDRVRIRGIAN